MQVIITATAPTVYQINSLRHFNLNTKQNMSGSYIGTKEFETVKLAKQFLMKRAELYNDADPCGNVHRLADMKRDINRGQLTLDAVTGHIVKQ